MRLIPLILQMSRVLAAIPLVAGPAGPVCAGFAGAPSSSNKDRAAIQPNGAETAQSVQAPSAGQIKLPLSFEANRGQTDASVKFFTRAAGYNLYLTASEAVMVMPKAAAGQAPEVLRMKLKGANTSPSVQGLEILPGYTNYLLGNDRSKWQTGVQQYAKVKFGQVYPGIDMVYRFDKGNVEYDFIVAPGANPGRILIGFEGAKSLRLDSRGNLVLRTDGGELTYKAPKLYQTLGGRKVSVKGRFVLASNKNARFEVGNYVKSQALVIDPALVYSSFLGGAVDDKAYAVAVDAFGSAYLTGSVVSATFPGTAGKYLSTNSGGASDAFVTKVNGAGTLAWSTYYGGAGDDIGKGIGVDGNGKIYITGSTTGSLPSEGLFGPGGGPTDAFVAAISANGTSLVYAKRFGGASAESGNGIAVDAAGNAYVAGHTTSMAVTDFPVTAGVAQGTGGGGDDAFVSKFSAAGALTYSTYLGGTNLDNGNAIAIDGSGNAYITGQCEDNFVSVVTYPNVFKNTITGSKDAFIAKLNAAGSTFLYKTYVGGSNMEEGNGIALDSANNVYITGWTQSANFPGAGFVTVGQTTQIGDPDAFVFKLRTSNTGLGDALYATYLGGSGSNVGTGIAVDSGLNAYVTGTTYAGDFPSVGPISGGGTLVGTFEAFVTQIGPTGGTVGFSTFLGGTAETGGQGIALDSARNIYVTGWTTSAAATFPLLTPFQAANAGSYDAFITKIGPVISAPSGCNITGLRPNSGFTLGGTTVTITGTGFSGFIGLGVSFDGTAARSYSMNASSTVITAVSPAHSLGSVPLRVITPGGTCSAVYNYVVATCGADRFFPSPATGATGSFAYCMALPGTARIRIYNAIGDLVAKIEDVQSAGPKLSSLNTARLAPGVYLYRLEKDYGNGNSTTSRVQKFVVQH